MSWLRYSDEFTRRAVWDAVGFEARWHYMAMVEECERSGRLDGRLPLALARRASDVPDPDKCVAELEQVGYVVREAGGPVCLPHIGEHIAPQYVRENAEKSKIRMRRARAHKRDDHSLCRPEHCPQAVTRNVTQTDRVTLGSGRVGSSASASSSNAVQEVTRNGGRGAELAAAVLAALPDRLAGAVTRSTLERKCAELPPEWTPEALGQVTSAATWPPDARGGIVVGWLQTLHGQSPPAPRPRSTPQPVGGGKCPGCGVWRSDGEEHACQRPAADVAVHAARARASIRRDGAA